MVLSHFMKNSWKFKNEKCLALRKHVNEDENQTFSIAYCLNTNREDLYGFCLQAKLTSSKTLFNEEFNREKGFRNTMM